MFNLSDKLPNPFATDYQYSDTPLDLYTEEHMIKFAEKVICECLNQIESYEIVNHNGSTEEEVVHAIGTIRSKIINHFGIIR